MKPTVGRIVHYRSYGTPGGEYTPECQAAAITRVASDGRVGLCVMSPTGMFFDQDVTFSETLEGGTWHWPERLR